MATILGVEPEEVTITALKTKTIDHGLGYKPMVQFIKANGDVSDGEVNHVSTKQMIVSWFNAFTGTVIYR